MRIRKYLSFFIRKFSDLFYEFSLFLKKQSTFIYPFTSINNLDKQISILLPNILNSKTFYIEVGANDGITQSNTFFLEKKYNAKGMLIEASPVTQTQQEAEGKATERNGKNMLFIGSDYAHGFQSLAKDTTGKSTDYRIEVTYNFKIDNEKLSKEINITETFDYKNINTYLTNYGYYLVKKLSAHDYLYTKKN